MGRVNNFRLWEELKKLGAYTKSNELSDIVSKVISRWQWLERKSIGAQYISCVDSISANIAEGYGRFFYKDKIKFYYYARGSALEAFCWTEKAMRRGLVSELECDQIIEILNEIPIEIHVLIQNSRSQLINSKIR